MTLLDGKTLAEKITSELKLKVARLPSSPRLDMLVMGDDFASRKYVEMKEKKAKALGIDGEIHEFAAKATTSDLIEKVNALNSDPAITGIMVQLPLPKTIDQNEVINTIDFRKDVDGLSAYSLGLLFQQHPYFVPATPKAVMRLLSEYSIPLEGKTVAMVGKSAIVGAPLVALLSQASATVTLCHSRTANLATVTSKCEVVITATGKPHLIIADHVKEGAVVIDVGITKHPDTGKTAGDVDLDSVKNKAAYISPVPGGVGPMTIAMLLENVIEKPR